MSRDHFSPIGYGTPMTDIVERLRKPGNFEEGPFLMAEAADEIERLRAALQNLMNDVLEYERINNLAPNPGKQDCWQSVTEARRALEPKP